MLGSRPADGSRAICPTVSVHHAGSSAAQTFHAHFVAWVTARAARVDAVVVARTRTAAVLSTHSGEEGDYEKDREGVGGHGGLSHAKGNTNTECGPGDHGEKEDEEKKNNTR